MEDRLEATDSHHDTVLLRDCESHPSDTPVLEGIEWLVDRLKFRSGAGNSIVPLNGTRFGWNAYRRAIASPPGEPPEWSMPVDFLSLFLALNQGNVRYVLVGGLAAVIHGVDRITADIDLAVDLAPQSAAELMRVLVAAGFRPMLPVDVKEFADPDTRRRWRQERAMQVFSLWDPGHTRPSVDVFVEELIPFEEMWRSSQPIALHGVDIRVASIEHLIRMKTLAGRPQDLADIERLREIQRAKP